MNRLKNLINYKIVNNGFDEINRNSKELIENVDIEGNLGVNLKLELVYAGSYSLSFIYKTEGLLGANTM